MFKHIKPALIGLAAAALLALGSAPPALSQAYPTNNPTYIPNAVQPKASLIVAGDYYFAANGVAGASVRFSAVTGTMVASIQGSNDPITVTNASANWTSLYAAAADGSVAAANSFSANGLWLFNTSGFTRFRVHVSTLTAGTVSINAVATPGPSVVYSINPNAGTQNTGTLPYPVGAVPITASATGTTAATTATLAAAAGKTTYLCGFSMRANATGAATGDATVTGVVTGTLHFTFFTAPLASGIGTLDPNLGPRCIPASAANTTVAVVSPAPGSGGTVSVSAYGFQL